jgi:hypothetical protein
MTDANTLALTDSGPVELNLDALIGSHLCIQANSGAGKSGAIRKVLEVTHGRVQHIVIDTEDEFYTLREKFEYLIAGGDNGDCAATTKNAAALATTILETGFSAIVQINSLPFDQRCVFIAEFLSALTNAPKRLWRPALIVLDEAQFYAPQKGYAPSLDAIVSLMMLGRKRGFTGILATPRPADLSKQATSPVNNWLVGRCGQPADRRSAADALGFPANSAEARNLRSLVARQFWVFGPALLNEPTLARIEKTQTTIIKAGQATLPTPPAPAAMQRILASLNAAAVEKVEEPLPNSGSNSGDENGSAEVSQAVIDAAEQRGFERGQEAGYERGAADMAASAQNAFEATRAAVQSVVAMLDSQIAVAFDKAAFAEVPPTPAGTFERAAAVAADDRFARPAVEALAKATTGKGIDVGDATLSSTMKDTLYALAWWKRMGHSQPTRKQLGALIDVKPGGSTMRSRLAALSNAGFIEYPNEQTVALTAASVAVCPRVNSGTSLIETIRSTLTTTECETFDAIPRAGETITREKLGAALKVDPTGSTMRSRLAALSNRELIDYPKAGLVARQGWVR